MKVCDLLHRPLSDISCLLLRIDYGLLTNSSLITSSSSESTMTGGNRSFTDTNTAQKLTDADIHQLRESGASAKEIITSLITNSETWNNKTEFSQEKWLMRKQKKSVLFSPPSFSFAPISQVYVEDSHSQSHPSFYL